LLEVTTSGVDGINSKHPTIRFATATRNGGDAERGHEGHEANEASERPNEIELSCDFIARVVTVFTASAAPGYPAKRKGALRARVPFGMARILAETAP